LVKERTGDDRFRIGVVGVGRICERVHLPLLTAMRNVVVGGIFDPDRERVKVVSSAFNVPVVCRSANELLNLNLDAVLIACPNHLHAEMSIAALEAQKHVLCEKPMATKASDAEAMLNAAEASGRNLMIAYANRFRPEVIALNNAIKSKQLGDIRAIRCGWLRRNGVPGAGTWFTSRERSGGGALTDLGSHLLDLVIWMCGRNRLLSACCVIDRTLDPQRQADWYLLESTGRRSDCDVETSATAFAVFDGPLDLFIEVSWACAVPYDRTYLQVIGECGTARIDTLFGLSPNGLRPQHPLQIWADSDQKPTLVAGSTDVLEPYRKQWEFFLKGIDSGRGCQSDLHDGLGMMRLIETMYRYAKDNERQALR
jgi:predicted dehydrogenase